MSTAPVVAGFSSAYPTTIAQEALWDDFFATRHRASRLARAAFFSVGVRQRHAVADPRHEDLSSWSTAARMERFSSEAPPLGKEAVSRSLAAASIAPDEVGLFVVVSCTGYVTPGLDIELARDLGMREQTQRLVIGHVGCHAALPALGAASDFVMSHETPAVVLCCELSSLHIQPMVDGSTSDALSQVVGHALFSDAAAAMVVKPSPAPGLRLLELATKSNFAAASHLRWEITDRGFRMDLSRELPELLVPMVSPLVTELLARNGLSISDVDHWAVHPGGPRVLDLVERSLDLSSGALEPSRSVLAEHGNCSSATVIVVLEQVVAELAPKPGEHVVALSFGPGLTGYAALFVAT